jgi:hypothetical protein
MGYHTDSEVKTNKPKVIKGSKPLYPHKMYLGNMIKEAKDQAEHMKLSKQGYSMKPKKMMK